MRPTFPFGILPPTNPRRRSPAHASLNTLPHPQSLHPWPRIFAVAATSVHSVFDYWNWKCALMSAATRSLIYLTSMAGTELRGSLSVALVETAYVIATAGLYAGLQQRALAWRPRVLGDLAIVLAVPALAQAFDWLTHRACGAPAPGHATFAVCVFAAVSALFHRHLMRRGAFLTGRRARSLASDFRCLPRLAAGFVLRLLVFLPQSARTLEAPPEAAS